MTRALTRTNFHSSKLIRTLADLAVLETAEPATAFAEKLGLWIDFANAIRLTSVHKASTANAPAAQPAQQSMAGDSPGDAFARVRIGMENTITRSSASSTARVRSELALPKLDAPLDDVRAYAPFRRYHQAHQRDMESNARSLRAMVRDSVAKASPQLQQLAALDAAFDGILGEREARLLSTIPSLLEKRFNHLRKAHQQTLLATQQTDDNPDAWMKPGAWLARFCGELQAVLLAELDLRLQPAVGLLEAFISEKSQQHV